MERAEALKILASYARWPALTQPPQDIILKALAQMSKMCGWDSPAKVEVGGDDELMALLKELRGEPSNEQTVLPELRQHARD
jgi:hypothetical protein